MSRNILVCNTKGGVGKSTISTQILPVLLYKKDKLNVFELDNNNVTNLKSNYVNFKHLELKNIDDAITDVEFSESDNIVDCGGGNDTKAVIKAFAQNSVDVDLFIVPISEDFEVIKNLDDTINIITQNFTNPKILVILNKAKNENADEFIFFKGSDKYNIKPYKNKAINDVKVVEDAEIISIIKNIYNTTILDMLVDNIYIIEDKKAFKDKIMKEAKEKFDDVQKQKEYFKQHLAYMHIMQDLVDFINKIKNIKL